MKHTTNEIKNSSRIYAVTALFMMMLISGFTSGNSIAQTGHPCPNGWVQSTQTYTQPPTPIVAQADFVPPLTVVQFNNRVGGGSNVQNHFYCCTFKLDKPCCDIIRAVLTVKVCALPNSAAQNDRSSFNSGSGWVSLGPVYTGVPAICPTPTVINHILTASEISALGTSQKLNYILEDDSKVLSAELQVTTCCPPNTDKCDANFTLSGTIAPSTNYFTLTATPATVGTWDINGCSFWWQVDDITANLTSQGLASAFNWYAPNQTASINFPGFPMTVGGPLTPNNGNTTPAGRFIQGHKYRITRGTWNCMGWHTNSYIVSMSSAARSETPKLIITEDKSYKPSESEVEKIKRNTQK